MTKKGSVIHDCSQKKKKTRRRQSSCDWGNWTVRSGPSEEGKKAGADWLGGGGGWGGGKKEIVDTTSSETTMKEKPFFGKGGKERKGRVIPG